MKLDKATRDQIRHWQNCKILTASAIACGLDATPELVNCHYKRFVEWHEGRLRVDRLVQITGINYLGSQDT